MMTRRLSVSVAMLMLAAASAAHAQYDDAIQERLMELTEKDPVIARILDNQTAAHEIRSYTKDEFIKHLEVEWLEYAMPNNGDQLVRLGSRGRGSVGSTLGGGVTWTDARTGKQESLTYDAATRYVPDKGLVVQVTIRKNEEPEVTTEHVFDNLQGVTVVLHEEPDGTKHIARYVPVLKPKREVLEYADHLTMRLSSAVLLADGQYAGQFTVSGPVVGIVSSDAGMRFEFGLKPFPGAAPLGKTDGRSIEFEFEGKRYRLISTEPITGTTSENRFWTVYVRGKPTEGSGAFFGTHTYTYDSLILQEVLDDVLR